MINIELPEVRKHPNRVPFSGCLTLVGTPSDKAPNGSRGHRVILERAAAEAALPTLLGMAISYKTGWDGHDCRQKVGVITRATLCHRKLLVSGFVFARDFPEIEQRLLTRRDLGMSYELADAHVRDMRAEVWVIRKLTFVGAAVLQRDKAAYRSTSFGMGWKHAD